MKNSASSEDQQELCKYSDIDLTPPKPRPPSIWLSKRFVVGILLFFGYIAYSMVCQVINIALIEMTVDKVELIGNQTVTKPPEFKWGSEKVAMILNIFWYGFLFSTVGGYLSQKFGGPVILGLSTLLTGVFTVATSFSAYWGFYPLLMCRGLIGLLESFTSASFSMVFARWIPTQERSTFMSSAISGMYVGTAIVYPFCGYLTEKWGWPMPFYAIGGMCVVWAILWLILVPNTPSNDKWISKSELDYILEGTGNPVLKKVNHPYKEIFKSPPFWALSMSKFAYHWDSAFTVVYLPIYIKDVTHSDISKVGLLSFIPNSCIFIIPTVGVLVTYWQNHSSLTITQIHKTVISAGFAISAILFAALPFTNNFSVSILYFVIIKLLLSCSKIFLEVITVDMAPNHSGLVSGLTLFWQTVGIIVTQTIIGFIVQNHKLQEWNVCFLLSAGVSFLNVIVFFIFGSSDPQSWSMSQSNEIET